MADFLEVPSGMFPADLPADFTALLRSFSIFNEFIKNKLKKFDKIFVQDRNSLDVLEKNNIRNVEF